MSVSHALDADTAIKNAATFEKFIIEGKKEPRSRVENN